MNRITLAAALSVAMLAISASAARFTTHFDGLEFTLQERQAQIPDKPDKATKKAAKAYKAALKALAKESTSLKTELKIAKKVVKLEKQDDDDLNGLLDGALNGFGEAIQARIDDLQARLANGSPSAKATPAKAEKALTQAQDRLGFALGQEKRKKVIGGLLQADGRASKAAKLLDKLGFTDAGGGDGGGDGGGGDGGGGESQCGGTPLASGEMAGGSFGGGTPWSGEEVIIDSASAQLVVTVLDCDEFGGRKYVLVLPSPLGVGSFDAMTNGLTLAVSGLAEEGQPIPQGNVTITRADTRLELTYSFNGATTFLGTLAIDLPQ